MQNADSELLTWLGGELSHLPRAELPKWAWNPHDCLLGHASRPLRRDTFRLPTGARKASNHAAPYTHVRSSEIADCRTGPAATCVRRDECNSKPSPLFVGNHRGMGRVGCVVCLGCGAAPPHTPHTPHTSHTSFSASSPRRPRPRLPPRLRGGGGSALPAIGHPGAGRPLHHQAPRAEHAVAGCAHATLARRIHAAPAAAAVPGNDVGGQKHGTPPHLTVGPRGPR